MQIMPRAGVMASLVAAVLVSTAANARAQTTAAAGQTHPPRAYRLGTAARPFGWSTAIGDLNADGRPDFAVADRLGRVRGLFAYSLEVSIAGVGSQSVTFDSPEAALAIVLLDVDHDHDLDVVVSAPMSRTVLRVWLNDGAGTFHEASAALPPGASLGDAEADATGPQGADVCAAAPAPRRGVTALHTGSRPFDAVLASDRHSTRQPQRPRRLHASPLRSRAPPRV
jgi:FG-GAP repeat protein